MLGIMGEIMLINSQIAFILTLAYDIVTSALANIIKVKLFANVKLNSYSPDSLF